MAEAEADAAQKAVTEAQAELDEANSELQSATVQLKDAEALKAAAEESLEAAENNYAAVEIQKAKLEAQQSEFQEKAVKLAEEMIKYHTVANEIEEKIDFFTYHVDGTDPNKGYIMVSYADKNATSKNNIQSAKCYAYEVGEDGKITVCEKKATYYMASAKDEEGNEYKFKLEFPDGNDKKGKLTTIYPDGRTYVDKGDYEFSRKTWWGSDGGTTGNNSTGRRWLRIVTVQPRTLHLLQSP